jgi:hypothetical protein
MTPTPTLSDTLRELGRVLPERFELVQHGALMLIRVGSIFHPVACYPIFDEVDWAAVEYALREECAARGWDWKVGYDRCLGATAEVWTSSSADAHWTNAETSAHAFALALTAAIEAGGDTPG